MGGSLDQEKLADMLLLATLTQIYSHFERRLEGAIDPQNAEVRVQLATASIDHFVKTCGPTLKAQVESRRPELLPALVAQRMSLNESLFELTKYLERPVFVGPVNSVFNALRRINLVLVGDSVTPSGRYAQSVKDMVLVESVYLDGQSISWSDLQQRNCVLYGTPSMPLIEALLSASGWQVTPTFIALGDLLVQGENLALIACRVRPTDQTLGDVVYTCCDERILVGINGLNHGSTDFVIGRQPEPGRYEVVLRGNFARTAEGYLLTTPVIQSADQPPQQPIP